VVEYAGVLTAVSLLALSLGGQLGSRVAAALPSTDSAAIRLVRAGAREQKVSVAGARESYAHAPYTKPVEKYLYATGWIGGTRDHASCLLTRLGKSSAERSAASELRARPNVLDQLRRRGITVRAAAATLVQGVVSACS
jgi:hypothetical protein